MHGNEICDMNGSDMQHKAESEVRGVQRGSIISDIWVRIMTQSKWQRILYSDHLCYTAK